MTFLEEKLLPKIGLMGDISRKKWVKEQLECIPDKSTILDVGAGELQYKQYCTHLNYISTDFGKYDGKGNEIGLHTDKWDYGRLDVIGDASSLGFKDEIFDVVLLSEVLEHIPYPMNALEEASRVLKKDGILIVTAPFASLTHFAPFHYCTGFSQYFYEFHLPKLGFNIIKMKKNGNFFSSLSTEIMRTKLISKQYTGKKLNYYEQFIFLLCLKIIEKLSKTDKNSNELWCSGIQVLAKKFQ